MKLPYWDKAFGKGQLNENLDNRIIKRSI